MTDLINNTHFKKIIDSSNFKAFVIKMKDFDKKTILKYLVKELENPFYKLKNEQIKSVKNRKRFMLEIKKVYPSKFISTKSQKLKKSVDNLKKLLYKEENPEKKAEIIKLIREINTQTNSSNSSAEDFISKAKKLKDDIEKYKKIGNTLSDASQSIKYIKTEKDRMTMEAIKSMLPNNNRVKYNNNKKYYKKQINSKKKI